MLYVNSFTAQHVYEQVFLSVGSATRPTDQWFTRAQSEEKEEGEQVVIDR